MVGTTVAPAMFYAHDPGKSNGWGVDNLPHRTVMPLSVQE